MTGHLKLLSLTGLMLLAGCASHRRKLTYKAKIVLEFRGIKDNRCEIERIDVDGQTGNQIVVCK